MCRTRPQEKNTSKTHKLFFFTRHPLNLPHNLLTKVSYVIIGELLYRVCLYIRTDSFLIIDLLFFGALAGPTLPVRALIFTVICEGIAT